MSIFGLKAEKNAENQSDSVTNCNWNGPPKAEKRDQRSVIESRLSRPLYFRILR